MSLYQCYTWQYELRVLPYEKLMDVLEAFFASYPGGDYTCEHREAYKLSFRRGQWKRFWGLGPLVPARLPKGQFEQWPLLIHVLARPSPEYYLIAIRYELYLPRAIRSLHPDLQTSVDQHARRELEDLRRYLAECTGSTELPEIEAK